MLVHEDLPSGKFYVNPDYAANSKKVQKQKKHLFLRSAFL